MVKKWQTVTEAHVDVKTTDSYLLHLFCVGFTKKNEEKSNNQVWKTSHALHQQVRQLQKVMKITTSGLPTNDLKK